MNLNILILALIMVESNGNDQAIGDNRKAYGCLQIHAIMVQDVNRIAKTNYKHTDAFTRRHAVAICRIYLNHYGGNWEEMARKWNGGPKGHKKEATTKYWHKVQRNLTIIQERKN